MYHFLFPWHEHFCDLAGATEGQHSPHRSHRRQLLSFGLASLTLRCRSSHSRAGYTSLYKAVKYWNYFHGCNNHSKFISGILAGAYQRLQRNRYSQVARVGTGHLLGLLRRWMTIVQGNVTSTSTAVLHNFARMSDDCAVARQINGPC